MEISFCLATRDPFGCPTSGINRVDGSVVPGYREEGGAVAVLELPLAADA